jgi:hypothetical protein
VPWCGAQGRSCEGHRDPKWARIAVRGDRGVSRRAQIEHHAAVRRG